MADGADFEYMARALRLAKRGLYTTHPNPRVGCVIVKGATVVGEGYHVRPGEPHAEVNALSEAGDAARGATAYITLEPCCHHGRTPPCTSALTEAGVARVVAAGEDPNPRVAGQGLNELAQAGVAVESGMLEAQARALNAGFFKCMERGQPYIRIKLAMSLDGRTAMASGESWWISGEAARRDVQFLRARSSAVLTGVETVLQDDPSLNVRLTAEDLKISGEVVQPLRVILDTQLRTPQTATLLGLPGRKLIFTANSDADRRGVLERAGAEVFVASEKEDKLDLDAVVQELARRGVREVQVEAGPRLCGALLRAGLPDELVIYLAGHLMGDGARGLFHLPGIETMAQRVVLEIDDIRAVGTDWRITAFPQGSGG